MFYIFLKISVHIRFLFEYGREPVLNLSHASKNKDRVERRSESGVDGEFFSLVDCLAFSSLDRIPINNNKEK